MSGESGSGTIFFTHCPLKCAYCQNALIAHGEIGREVSVDELADMCLDLQAQGALNINMVTPTHVAPFIREGVRLARERGLVLPVVWNTSGYESVQAVLANAGTVDVYLTDFKYASEELGKRYSHVDDYVACATAALDAMLAQVGEPHFDEYHGQARLTRGVVVRHLLLPGHAEDSKRVLDLLHERYGSQILVSIMNQYTPLVATLAQQGNDRAIRELERCPELAYRVPDEVYEEVLDYADALGMTDYFWQDGGAAEESFIPAFSS